MTATTTLARPQPVQAGLLGVEPPPDMLEVRSAHVGQVRRRAELRMSPDGQHAHLVVELAQPPHGGHSRPPIVAVRHGSAADVPAFEALAASLTPGTLALITCRGMDWDAQRHELRAWRCDHVKAIPAAEASEFTSDVQLDVAAPNTPPERTS